MPRPGGGPVEARIPDHFTAEPAQVNKTALCALNGQRNLWQLDDWMRSWLTRR